MVLVSDSYASRAEAGDLAVVSRALSASAGMVVEARVATTAVGAIEAIGTNRADAALLPLFEYLLARHEYGATALLQVMRKGESYRGVILARRDSGITSVSALAGKKIAYVDRYSTSGYLFPRRLLAGVAVEPVFAGSHASALAKLMAKEVDAAATFEGASEGEVTVIATTGEIPNEPVFVRKDLEPAIREALAKGFTSFAATEEGRAVLGRLGGITGLRPIGDGEYATVTETLRALGERPSDVVKGGQKVNPAPVEVVP